MNETERLTIEPNVYYTVEEAAQRLRISSSTMLRLLRSKGVRGVKIGRKWLILGAVLLNLSSVEEEPESAMVADWFAASGSSLREVWDNEEDAIYDKL